MALADGRITIQTVDVMPGSEGRALGVIPHQISTRRLVLRPVEPNDVDALFSLLSDEEVAYFALPGPATREWVQRSLAADPPWHDQPDFAVVLDGEVVGRIVLEIDRPNGIANLGYVIARKCWGKGFATEAAESVVDYGFHEFGLDKVYARADPRNVGSVRVLEKLSMRREGLLRNHVVRRGERCDRVYYGLLREEWEIARGMK